MVEYDMDELEKEKENVQATKYGYKPDVIGKDYEHLRRIKEAELNKVHKEDPLLPYIDYIKWTTKHFTYTHPSIPTVMETAVREFRKDPRYKNDPRYVDLWMTVVRKQPDPGDAFKYLAVNQIGTGLAIYYLEYARYYESGKDYDRADELYRLGISRKADPVDEIVKEYNKFLVRKASGIPLEDKPLTKKKVLQPKTSSKDKLKVFKDSSEPEDVLVPEASAGWEDYSLKAKENEAEPEKWVGNTYKQESAPSANPKLNVYKDEHEEVAPRKKPKIFKPKAVKDDLLAEQTATADMNGSVLVTKMELLKIKNKEYCFEENRAISYGYDINERAPRVEKPKFKPASPTINTKDAMRDIMDIFNAPIQGDTEVDQVIYYNPQDDETISSKVFKRPVEELKLGVFKDEDSDEDSSNPVETLFSEGTPRTVKNVFGQPVQIMTPVTEKSEVTFHHTSASFEAITEEEEPVHPSDPQIRAAILKKAYDPQNKSFDFYPSKESNLKSDGNTVLFNAEKYKIVKILAENDYSKVYAVQKNTTKVLKISTPPSGWEYYILHQIHSKTRNDFIIKPLHFYFYKNESILELSYEPGSTLLDVFNSCRKLKIGRDSPGIDELLVLHYSIKLLDISIFLFKNGFIHGDLRLENYITRNRELVLVDFGAAIDLNHFKPTQMFQIPKSDQLPHEECWECRFGQPFKYEPDLYNLACMIHILLFGKLLETNPQSAKKEKIKVVGKFEKDWNIELWNNLFIYLLNSSDWSELQDFLLAMKQCLIQHERNTELEGEIRFGDNDSLSAIVAGMVHADYLFLLTDVDSLYTDNPRSNPNAARIKVVKDISVLKEQGSSVGTGGMITKLIAAELSISAGCNMIITIGSKPNLIETIIREIQENENNKEFEPSHGTLFLAREKPMDDRQWWILHSLATAGKLIVDEGASIAITRKSKSSLFAAGIKQVIGSFNALQCVKIVKIAKRVSIDGREEEYEQEIGRGLVNYSSLEIQRILGSHSKDIAEILGYRETEYVISRDNMAIISQ
ncbi:hypothetical protein HK103_001642 [Boothiomyces macroporosus]|uniref:Non-specific serine/threonine protein kinase n=1 Tax=Boothiomyces macroporosus TaxID=261099 RepID=A0AAD5Y0S2_9FUNG|nr:hypothetical protein HK103_001642 [Boothiomyces macroporosus]